MSEAETEIQVPDAYDDVDEWAIAAVRGSNNWLVTLRNAIDEGIAPWNDEYITTEGDGKNSTGIMSYSEGLTALALVKQFAPTERSDWKTVRPRYYHEDLSFILNEINHEDGPRLKPAPYVDVDTQDFTVAATFSTSAILESIKSGAVDFGEGWETGMDVNWVDGDIKIEKEDATEALEKNLEWLLSNKVEEDIEPDNAAGWAWLGSDSESPKYGRKRDPPTNYFTYSAALVLCDILRYMRDDNIEDGDVIRRAVEGSETEIVSVVEQAGNFLTDQYWDGECWSMPQGGMSDGGRRPGQILSSCYAVLGISYIADTLNDMSGAEFDLDDSKKERMGKSLNTVLSYYENIGDAWGEGISYDCGGDGDLTDGSTPYVMIDTIIELAYRVPDTMEYMDDYDEDKVKNIATGELAQKILGNCWAGDERFERKGFRHLARPDLLREMPDGSPSHNPTAIYSTGVAIETLLLNFLREGEDIEEKVEGTGEETSQPTGTTMSDEAVETSQPGQDKTVNVFLNSEGGEGVDEEIEETLEDIHKEVEGLSGEIRKEIKKAGSAGDIEIEEYEERNLEFIDRFAEAREHVSEEYKNKWREEIYDNLSGSAVSSLSNLDQFDEWEHEFRYINTSEFFEYLSGLYFCPNRETYEEEVTFLQEDIVFLLPPQREVYEEVEDWGKKDFADPDRRKSYVEEKIKEFKEEPWGGENPKEVAREFSDRYEEEAVN